MSELVPTPRTSLPAPSVRPGAAPERTSPDKVQLKALDHAGGEEAVRPKDAAPSRAEEHLKREQAALAAVKRYRAGVDRIEKSHKSVTDIAYDLWELTDGFFDVWDGFLTVEWTLSGARIAEREFEAARATLQALDRHVGAMTPNAKADFRRVMSRVGGMCDDARFLEKEALRRLDDAAH